MQHDGIVNQLLKETEYIECRPRTSDLIVTF